MNRLRNRLILIFLAATLVPFAATLWITTSLLEQSLSYSSTVEVDQLAKSLERTGQEFYQRVREDLKSAARGGHLAPNRYLPGDREQWPDPVKEFAESGEPERFVRFGNEGDQLGYLVRHGQEIWQYTESLGGIGMERLSRQLSHARTLIQKRRDLDLRRGLTLVFILAAASAWLISLALLVYLAHRVSRPIQQLTAGLGRLAGGDLGTRVETGRNDEVGRAIQAFNHMAGQLEESTARLVYLTQLASWQTLARKMAHEVKNSLTPIRLTVEEMLARYEDRDQVFMEQAAQIVVEEVEGLER
ncbi:MAG TPA: HAMP domain-containing protein, partial [Bryobacteraceae bacterium]|nr:HAMP domain-containing protein [Bryobacteraceae bacterium]